jgi:hypothetical protein
MILKNYMPLQIITKDNTGVEYYCTIFAAVESEHEEGVIWTGSDDGLVYITKDGGENWTNVTPSGMPEWIMINSLEVDPFNKGGLYIAATMYKSGDYRPYLYRTLDYGNTWVKITNGIDEGHFTRVVRADPKRKGLLYCGTESGMYISFDNGQSWQAWQLNLPIVPITDLTIKNNNLIAATQGRSFWLIDDLTPLQEFSPDIKNKESHLFSPMASYRIGGSQNTNIRDEGTNHPGGVLVNFYLREEHDTSTNITLKFLDNKGKLIREFSNSSTEKKDKLEVKKGFNQFAWDMRYPAAEGFDNLIMWWANLVGPVALPGKYAARMVCENDSMESQFTILKDPRSETSDEALKSQFEFLVETSSKFTETSNVIKKIRESRKQLDFLKSKLDEEEHKELITFADSIGNDLSNVEQTLYQTKNQSRQDPLNYPIKLNNKLGHLMTLTNIGNYQPTEQAIAFKNEVFGEIDAAIAEFDRIREQMIPELNQMVKEADIKAVSMD